MAAATIDVVIVNYNGGDALIRCVTSVLRSSVPVRVLVSDNGSQDDSITKLRCALAGDARLTLIENHRNLGFARGNNVALPRCCGEYVLFLNPDCEMGEDTLERMQAVMAAHPEAGMAGCLVRNRDGSEQAGCRRFVPTPWRAFVRVFRLSRIFHNNPRFSSFILTGQPLPEGAAPVEAISGAFMFVRRAAMERVGPMDEGYFLHCEDLDWCMRFREAGYSILFVPDVTIVHTKGVASAGRPVSVEWHKHRGMIRFYRKFFRRRYPSLLMLAVVSAVWARFAMIASALMATRVLLHARGDTPASNGRLSLSAAVPDDRVPAVIVTGATSQIGIALIPRLREAGYRIHAISRTPASTGSEADPLVLWHQIDIVRNPERLHSLRGASILIHLAPLETLAAWIDAACEAGIRRIVAFGSTSRYSKLGSSDPKEQRWVLNLIESEKVLATKCEARGIPWTLFRPTLIYGYGTDRNVTTIAKFVSRFGFFPLVGEGKGLRRPVHADDLAAACLAVLDRRATFNRAYNLSGGETLTYLQMVEAIFHGLGRKPRVLRIPRAVFAALLKVARLWPAYRHLNMEMVNRINTDLDFDHREATSDFGYCPRKFAFPRPARRSPHERRPVVVG